MINSTHALSGDFTGCGHIQPDHSYEGERIQYDAGKVDGFLRAASDTYSIGYYQEKGLTFFGALARQYTTLDRYFCSFMGPTVPNRIFQCAAQTDRITDTSELCELETIWDSLAEAGVSARWYSPYVIVWGSDYADISCTYQDYLNDAASGQLPAVSFVVPPYTPGAGATDDHPFADIRNGDAFSRRCITP